METNKPRVIAVVGPTASGKTSFAIDLATKVGGEIICADSRTVYKGFDIGTAKPTKAEMGVIKHHLLDIREPYEVYSAGDFVEDAKKIIKKIISRKNVPIIAGGTGLYIDMLLKNYDLPKVKPDYKYRLELMELNDYELYELLLDKDNKAVKYISVKDRPKIIRALEIIKHTGKPLAQSKKKGEVQYCIEWYGRNFERSQLYHRIDLRVDLMLEKGLLKETKKLYNEYGKTPNLLNTIGYREMLKYLTHELTLEEATDLLKQNTRNFAKRQLTWFRKNKDINWNVYPEKLDK